MTAAAAPTPPPPGPPPAAPRRSSPTPPPNEVATTRTMSFAGDSARFASTWRAGSSSSSPAAITPPPMTTTSGLKMFTRFAIPTPSRSPTTRTAAPATGSPSNASSVISGPVSARPSSSATPERRVRLARHAQRRLAHERRARGDRLEAAPVRAVALARRAVDVDDHVPHLGARADPAAVEPPAEHEAAADPRPDREQRDVRGPARGARLRLRPDRAVGVVVDLDRQAEPLAHHLAELQIGERQVDRLDRHAGPAIERAGDSEADGLYVPVNCLASLLDRVDRRVEQRRLVDPEDFSARSVVNGEPLGVDRSGQELGPAQIDADHAAGRHFDHDTPPAMADEKPTYTKYRSRPKLFGEGLGQRRARGARRPARRRPAPRGSRTSGACATASRSGACSATSARSSSAGCCCRCSCS